jgi:hypothetical protein
MNACILVIASSRPAVACRGCLWWFVYLLLDGGAEKWAVRFIKPPNPEDENLNVQFGRKKTRQKYLVVL